MNGKKMKLITLRGRKQSGYTLLEYCAGAAIIAGIIFVTLNTLETHLTALLENIGTWVTARSTQMNQAEHGGSGTTQAQN